MNICGRIWRGGLKVSSGESAVLRLRLLNCLSGGRQQRFLCSKKDGEAETPKDEAPKVEGSKKSSNAKAKLDSLLMSIVQQSKEAAERKSQDVVNMKLAKPVQEKEPSPDEGKSEEELEAEKDLGKEMVQAVKKVAETVSQGDTEAVESELVQKLKTQVGKKVNLTDVFAGMKIDRSKASTTTSSQTQDFELSRAHRVRRMLDEKSPQQGSWNREKRGDSPPVPRHKRPPPSSHPTYIPIDLFGAPPLGIFIGSKTTSKPQPPKLETWDALHSRDLKLSVTHPPANAFEEMILWTEQGKLWKFPIDNEQGLDEEAKVPFHEHVFLEPQLESWCPKKGPIRHFMELVCVGLSKNPFLTVKEKHTQIEWYHQYFKQKADIIKDVGAGEIK